MRNQGGKNLENIVILCFKRLYLKKHTAARLSRHGDGTE